MVSLLAAAGLTAMLMEVAPLRPELAKASVILVATVCERLVKATIPPPAVRFVAPCKFPLPPLARRCHRRAVIAAAQVAELVLNSNHRLLREKALPPSRLTKAAPGWSGGWLPPDSQQ